MTTPSESTATPRSERSPTWFDAREACPVRCVTPGEGHFFFGYYEKSPWRPGGSEMLACRAGFMDRPPGPDDEIEVGLVNPRQPGGFTPLATTRAWNWQQGCMLQWLDESRIVFNDRRGDRFVAVILHVDTGERRELPRPIYTVSAANDVASSLNFARLHRLRPGYGYAGVEDPTAHAEAPADDGLWVMRLSTGEASLICSIDEARRLLPEREHRTGRAHWMNHAQFAPGGQRLAVLHRWHSGEPSPPWRTRMLTLNVDGSERFPLVDLGMASHYDWGDDRHLVAYARAPRDGAPRDGFFVFRDQTPAAAPLAPDQLSADGHCSYSPDRRWVLNDTYPDPADRHRTLMLIRVSDQAIFTIGRFLGPMGGAVEIRCDLHPRWSRDGAEVCIDSIHEGRRAMYVIDVRGVVQR